MRDPFLVLHIVSGTAAMALGALALLAAARRHPRGDPLVGAYPWAVLATCSTATALALLEWSRLWWIVPLALVSSLLALAGYLALRRGGPKGVVVHGLGGSYIALVTALLVVSAGDLSTTAEIVAWIVPIALGVPLIVWFERANPGVPAHARHEHAPHQTESRGPKPDAGATPDQRLHHRWPAAEPGHFVGEPRIEVVRSHIYEVFSGGHFLVHHIEAGCRHTSGNQRELPAAPGSAPDDAPGLVADRDRSMVAEIGGRHRSQRGSVRSRRLARDASFLRHGHQTSRT